MPDRLAMSVAQASEISGLSPDRIRALCSAGLIGYKENRQWLILRKELEKYLDSQFKTWKQTNNQ